MAFVAVVIVVVGYDWLLIFGLEEFDDDDDNERNDECGDNDNDEDDDEEEDDDDDEDWCNSSILNQWQ